jgi:FAD/FMN-containing dehydrogenase
MSTTRRQFLVSVTACAGALSWLPTKVLAAVELLVDNITKLYSVRVARIETPSSTLGVSKLVREWGGKVAVGGGRFSMGGQVAIRDGLHLDMRSFNKLVWLRSAEKVARVQAGMTWRDLQDLLDPLNLAVKTMQSYSNFTVGGSVSVNAHGRYVGHGPVGNTVRALQLILADGSIVEASRKENFGLLQAAVGGYGAVGVISEVELELADNVHIERRVVDVPLSTYCQHFERVVLSDPDCVLHNADLLPPHFDAPRSVTWRRTIKPLTERDRLVARGRSYVLEQSVIWALSEIPQAERLRQPVIEPLLTGKPKVQWLNHEASRDVAELEPASRVSSTYVLQEYFVPPRNFLRFVGGMREILVRYEVDALNISVRHSPADSVALLPWAKESVFALVLYFKQRTAPAAQELVGHWTRELIELALANEGRYYLPYQLHATVSQFERAYPEVAALRSLKVKVDPSQKFSNELWAKYL